MCPVRLRFSIRARPEKAPAQAGSGAAVIERVVEVPFDSGEAVIGRQQGAAIELPFPSVSLKHARLFHADSGYRIEDLGSANGTWLGRRRLVPQVSEIIAVGEVVHLGGVELGFEGDLSASEARSAEAGTATLARRLVHDIFEASSPAECARLVVEAGPGLGRELALAASGRIFKLGRGELCDLVVPDDDVSREHASFERGPEGITVRDLGSKNGVEVQGQRVVGALILRDGDIVRVGSTQLRVVDPEERYLRQMEAGDVQPTPSAASFVAAAAKDAEPSRGRLPLVAAAIAVTALVLALGLVLALAFAA
jgi:pSer/pThr/pTyr-binding forkhead associated (FHA) protein